jgi:hypothetical protein
MASTQLFVAVGTSFLSTSTIEPVIEYSYDGLTWSRANLNGAFSGGSVTGVATDNQGNWVAVGVGAAGGEIGYSRDGINWSNKTNLNGLFSGGAGGVASDNQGNWVAVGSGVTGGEIGYSTDGINWTKSIVTNGLFSGVPVDPPMCESGTPGEGIPTVRPGAGFAVAADGRGNWVVTGRSYDPTTITNNGDIGYSTDGRTWTKMTNLGGLFIGGEGKRVATDKQGKWVVVGESNIDLCMISSVGQIGYSADGRNWTIDTNTGGLFNGNISKNSGNGVAADGQGNWVAVGSVDSPTDHTGQIGYSTNGQTWSVATNTGGLFNTYRATGSGQGRAVATNGRGTWVAVGVELNNGTYIGEIGYSADGRNWTTVAISNGYVYTDIACATPKPVSNICFPAGTPVQTDQGIVDINNIDPAVHTLRGQAILHITQTTTLDKYLICIEQGALQKNVPSQRTVMTKDHQIMYNNILVPAHRFLLLSKAVTKVTYSGEVLYNVLLAKHSTMTINNLVCETLHPDNVIAQLYNGGFNAAKEAQERAHVELTKQSQKMKAMLSSYSVRKYEN